MSTRSCLFISYVDCYGNSRCVSYGSPLEERYRYASSVGFTKAFVLGYLSAEELNGLCSAAGLDKMYGKEI